MEFGGVLWCKPTKNHLLRTMEQVKLRRCRDTSWGNENKKVIFVSWQVYPEMGTNKFFENQILESNIKKDSNLYFICRSGQRSYNAAEFLTSRGFSNCFNVIDGFEGKINHERQRALIDGWQFNNLPWKQ